jgi:hypothetical protein
MNLDPDCVAQRRQRKQIEFPTPALGLALPSPPNYNPEMAVL